MTVNEATELIRQMKEQLNIGQPVVLVPSPSQEEEETEEIEAESTELFSVRITRVSRETSQLCRIVARLLDIKLLSAKLAMDAIDSGHPLIVAQDVPYPEAEKIKNELMNAKASLNVEI